MGQEARHLLVLPVVDNMRLDEQQLRLEDKLMLNKQKNSLQDILNIFGFVLIILIFIAQQNCGASNLNPIKKDNAPKGATETEIDMSALNFTDIETEATINLKEYMDNNDLNHVLLMFNIKTCLSCMEKAEYIRDHVIGKDSIFESEAGQHFEIIGINADALAQKFLAEQLHQTYSFIKWWDPSGSVMIKNMLPPGYEFGVPFVILLSRTGFLWRLTNDVKIDPAELMKKVAVSLGTSSNAEPTTTEKPTPTETPVIISSDLILPAVGRLNSLAVEDCSHATVKFGEQLKADLKFVQIVNGSCDSKCMAQHNELLALGADCGAAGKYTCAVATFTTGELTSALCAKEKAFKGSDEFFKIFAPHFDWKNPRSFGTDNYPWFEPLKGPIILGFDQKEKLVFSFDSSIEAFTSSRVTTAVNSSTFGVIPRGYEYSLTERVGEDINTISFPELRGRAKITIVNLFVKDCGSCIDGLKRMSAPGNLFDMCKNAPNNICQAVAIEVGYIDPDLITYTKKITDTIAALGIRWPVLIDPNPLQTDEEYLARFFEGYLGAVFKTWKGLYGTVIYDQESKLLGGFKDSLAPDLSEEERLVKTVETLISKYSQIQE